MKVYTAFYLDKDGSMPGSSATFISKWKENSDDFSMPFEVPVPKLGEEVHGADNQSRFCVFFFVGFFSWMLLR